MVTLSELGPGSPHPTLSLPPLPPSLVPLSQGNACLMPSHCTLVPEEAKLGNVPHRGPRRGCCLGAVSRAGSEWHRLPGLRGVSLPNAEDRQLVITLGQSALGRGARTPAIGERGKDAQICWSSLKRSRKCPEPQLCLGPPRPALGPPPHPESPAPSLWFTPRQLLWGPRPLKNSVCKALGS